jgi:hypothetical protein
MVKYAGEMVKYEVIDYEVSADPVAEPVASSTSLDGEVSSTRQRTCIVFETECVM